eukprot:gnl/Spiro4/27523_TR13685_c0_g1_i1.p1 gnl/Spiro4/27523_TR13685_c0_g1~~gnl/Spiro4/27523_TR13685_c0_g1_i1.p1  ORF type:complete len:284 (-),score=42.62 gnl/Spiro4/27523_TR13685_c0_g1_i1:6-821(-)
MADNTGEGSASVSSPALPPPPRPSQPVLPNTSDQPQFVRTEPYTRQPSVPPVNVSSSHLSPNQPPLIGTPTGARPRSTNYPATQPIVTEDPRSSGPPTSRQPLSVDLSDRKNPKLLFFPIKPAPYFSDREWHSGLFECFRVWDHCCCGTFCFPCLLARNKHRFDDSDVFCNFFSVTILLHLCLCWVVSMGWRSSMRRELGIAGTDVGDCCIHAFCMCCAACQEARELDFERMKRLEAAQGSSIGLDATENVHDTPIVFHKLPTTNQPKKEE